MGRGRDVGETVACVGWEGLAEQGKGESTPWALGGRPRIAGPQAQVEAPWRNLASQRPRLPRVVSARPRLVPTPPTHHAPAALRPQDLGVHFSARGALLGSDGERLWGQA